MIRWVARGESEPAGLTVTQSEVWRTLKQSPIVETKTRSIPRNLRPVLAALEKAGHAERDIEIVPIKVVRVSAAAIASQPTPRGLSDSCTNSVANGPPRRSP